MLVALVHLLYFSIGRIYYGSGVSFLCFAVCLFTGTEQRGQSHCRGVGHTEEIVTEQLFAI